MAKNGAPSGGSLCSEQHQAVRGCECHDLGSQRSHDTSCNTTLLLLHQSISHFLWQRRLSSVKPLENPCTCSNLSFQADEHHHFLHAELCVGHGSRCKYHRAPSEINHIPAFTTAARAELNIASSELAGQVGVSRHHPTSTSARRELEKQTLFPATSCVTHSVHSEGR